MASDRVQPEYVCRSDECDWRGTELIRVEQEGWSVGRVACPECRSLVRHAVLSDDADLAGGDASDG